MQLQTDQSQAKPFGFIVEGTNWWNESVFGRNYCI